MFAFNFLLFIFDPPIFLTFSYFTFQVESVPGRKLIECIEPFLILHGISADVAEFFLEKSSTPIPENSDAKFLAGHKIFVRSRFIQEGL